MCTRLVPLKGFAFISAVMDLPSSLTSSSSPLSSFCWTPLHGAIARDNVDLFDRLVDLGGGDKSTFNDNYYSHFLAVSSAGSAMCEQVVGACSSISAPHNILLNSTGGSCYKARPLHLATRSNHSDVVKRLLKCSKVDPNLRDEMTGMTAVHEACKDDNLNILSIFGSVSDRLDLLMTDFHGKTCIDIAIERKNVQMLELLVKMRRNDVLERVLHARHSSIESPSILVSLELENIQFAKSLGYVLQTTELADGGCIEEKSEVDNDNRFENKILNPTEIDVAIVESMRDMEIRATNSPSRMAEQSLQAEKSKLSLQNRCIVDNREKHQSLDPIAAMKEMLAVSNQIVKILIVAAHEAGITDREFHAHPCYSQGTLFTEHVRVSHS